MSDESARSGAFPKQAQTHHFQLVGSLLVWARAR